MNKKKNCCSLLYLPLPSIIQYGNQTVKGIADRHKGKEGRFRNNLIAKRNNFGGRTVITPDCFMDASYFAVSLDYAMTMTYPEKVNDYNIADLKRRVLLGPNHKDGAKYIIMPDGSVISLTDDLSYRKNIYLKPGWIVERHLKDGDYLLVNRQPSLHRLSMQVFKTKIVNKIENFSLHISCCMPFNADFDGDEMAAYPVQTQMARAESKYIMNVTHQIVSPQNHRAITTVIQDGISGSYLLTHKDTFITKEQAMQLLMSINFKVKYKFINNDNQLPIPAILKPNQLWTGKQIFSHLIPVNTYYEHCVRELTFNNNNDNSEQEIMDLQERYIKIINGDLICGSLCKEVLGSSKYTLIQLLWKDFGHENALNFISDVFHLSYAYLEIRGFTFSSDDCLNFNTKNENIEQQHFQIKKQIDYIYGRFKQIMLEIEQYIFKEFDLNRFDYLELEQIIHQLYNKLLDYTGRLIKKNTFKNNAAKIMSICGSKGSETNSIQMRGSVGTQTLHGQRIGINNFLDNKRFLPSFDYGDTSIESSGYIKNSFSNGISPNEFFMHAISGREGVVDTSIKTSRSGYLQRKLTKGLQSHHLTYDRTVRNEQDEIIQFVYGGDGYDSTMVEENFIYLKPLKINMQCESLFCIYCNKNFEYEQIKLLKHKLFSAKSGGKIAYSNNNYTDEKIQFLAPINIERIITTNSYKWKKKIFDHHECIDHELFLKILQETINSIKSFCYDFSTILEFEICLRINCTFYHPNYKFYLATKIQWIQTCQQIYNEFTKSFCEPGEMVGIIASQSIGEPATQMNMKSFHYSGSSSSKNVSSGVPRLTELLDNTHNMKLPCTSVVLNETWASNKKQALLIGNMMVEQKLYNLISDYQTCWINLQLKKDFDNNDNKNKWLDHTSQILPSHPKFMFLKHAIITSYYEKNNKTTSTLNNDIAIEQITKKKFKQANEIMYYPQNHPVMMYKYNKQLMNNKDITINELKYWFTKYLIKNQKSLWLENYFFVWSVDFLSNYDQYNVQEQNLEKKNNLNVDVNNKKNKKKTKFDENEKGKKKNNNNNTKTFYQKEEEEELFKLNFLITKYLQEWIVKKMILKGIENFFKFTLSKNNNNWLLNFEGSNLKTVLSHPAIDYEYSWTNNIREINESFGIDAGNEILYNEINQVMSFDGTYVQLRHILIVSDTMTHKGKLVPINRFGLNRLDSGFLTKVTFEETSSVLYDSAAYSKTDYLSGIPGNIIMGARPSIMGTGHCKILTLLNCENEENKNKSKQKIIDNNNPNNLYPSYKLNVAILYDYLNSLYFKDEKSKITTNYYPYIVAIEQYSANDDKKNKKNEQLYMVSLP